MRQSGGARKRSRPPKSVRLYVDRSQCVERPHGHPHVRAGGHLRISRVDPDERPPARPRHLLANPSHRRHGGARPRLDHDNPPTLQRRKPAPRTGLAAARSESRSSPSRRTSRYWDVQVLRNADTPAAAQGPSSSSRRSRSPRVRPETALRNNPPYTGSSRSPRESQQREPDRTQSAKNGRPRST